jgi:hypothetical protein
VYCMQPELSTLGVSEMGLFFKAQGRGNEPTFAVNDRIHSFHCSVENQRCRYSNAVERSSCPTDRSEELNQFLVGPAIFIDSSTLVRHVKSYIYCLFQSCEISPILSSSSIISSLFSISLVTPHQHQSYLSSPPPSENTTKPPTHKPTSLQQTAATPQFPTYPPPLQP